MKITKAIGRAWCRKFHRKHWTAGKRDGDRHCGKCGRKWHKRAGWRRMGLFA